MLSANILIDINIHLNWNAFLFSLSCSHQIAVSLQYRLYIWKHLKTLMSLLKYVTQLSALVLWNILARSVRSTPDIHGMHHTILWNSLRASFICIANLLHFYGPLQFNSIRCDSIHFQQGAQSDAGKKELVSQQILYVV